MSSYYLALALANLSADERESARRWIHAVKAVAVLGEALAVKSARLAREMGVSEKTARRKILTFLASGEQGLLPRRMRHKGWRQS